MASFEQAIEGEPRERGLVEIIEAKKPKSLRKWPFVMFCGVALSRSTD